MFHQAIVEIKHLTLGIINWNQYKYRGVSSIIIVNKHITLCISNWNQYKYRGVSTIIIVKKNIALCLAIEINKYKYSGVSYIIIVNIAGHFTNSISTVCILNKSGANVHARLRPVKFCMPISRIGVYKEAE